jgi:hypothetical protein
MPMANYLQMHKKQQVLALLELGWSYRRIQRETGVHRATVGDYDAARHANPAKTFPGSDASPPADLGTIEGEGPANPAKAFAGSPPNPAKTFPGSTARRRFVAHGYRQAITEKLDAGLSLQRIWQDLVEEYGYSASYESVKRFVRTLTPTRRAVGVFHCAPGADYGERAVMVSRLDCVPLLIGAASHPRIEVLPIIPAAEASCLAGGKPCLLATISPIRFSVTERHPTSHG